jgi:F420-dependent methylenetetrahydromethanopterin dehydrogenase
VNQRRVVIVVEESAERFALTVHRLEHSWCFGWAQRAELVETWLERFRPAALLATNVAPADAPGLARTLLRLSPSPLVLHLSTPDEEVEKALKRLGVGRVLSGALSFGAIHNALTAIAINLGAATVSHQRTVSVSEMKDSVAIRDPASTPPVR